jgi:hypothetical protein
MTSNYTFNSLPIIQGGTATTTAGGVVVTFTKTFPTDSVYVCSNPSTNAGTSIVCVSFSSISKTGFTMHAYLKDGRSGQDGGGPYNGTMNWIAISD